MTTSTDRLQEIRGRIRSAAERSGRHADDVDLVVVSKTFEAEAIRPVLEAGARRFGENRVQEAKRKWPALRDEFADAQLHLIGPLQSNKTADAVALFDVIETVDREKIAREIARETVRQGRKIRVFVQVDIGREAQKSGIDPAEAVAFVERCRLVHGLAVEGLMCIPPAATDPRPFFRALAALARAAGVAELSMGMSGDFEPAIEEGATAVRVGSAIFGARG